MDATRADAARLSVESLGKSFDGVAVLRDISLQAQPGEFICLLGPSGCGKTTLLRIIAGLEAASSGSVHLGGRDLAGVPARERGFGIVFQSYSLFPYMTVAQNVGYGLRIRGARGQEISARVDELLAMTGMAGHAERLPWQLSGGQQQRVAMARALAVNPAVLLLDEPFSALDARVRVQLRGEVHALQRRLRVPTLMVTHDQEEALVMADRVACMNEGRIEQIGTPREIYARPRTRFVASFIGAGTLLGTAFVREHAPALLEGRPSGAENAFEVCVRPEDVRLDIDPAGDAQVTEVQFLGSIVRVTAHWHGVWVLADMHPSRAPSPGDAVNIWLDPSHCAWVTA
jgi:iron(III) transport system ATP-binding protein